MKSCGRNLLVPTIIALAVVITGATWFILSAPEQFGTGIAGTVLFTTDSIGVANAVIRE